MSFQITLLLTSFVYLDVINQQIPVFQNFDNTPMILIFFVTVLVIQVALIVGVVLNEVIWYFTLIAFNLKQRFEFGKSGIDSNANWKIFQNMDCETIIFMPKLQQNPSNCIRRGYNWSKVCKKSKEMVHEIKRTQDTYYIMYILHIILCVTYYYWHPK